MLNETRRSMMTGTVEAKRLISLFRFAGRPDPFEDAPALQPDALAQPLALIQNEDAFNPEIRSLKTKHIPFSVFNPKHAELAADVVRILVKASTFGEFEFMLKKLRAITNIDFYNYVLSVASLRRPDTFKIRPPPAFKLMPNQFFPVIESIARHMSTGRRKPMDEINLDVDETGTDLDPEHRLAYFREDLGMNSHHWHWHVVYPWYEPAGTTKDRKGELFFYMHRQLLARYDAERLSLGLERVKALDKWEEPIPEGYAPHLINEDEGAPYAARVPGLTLKSVKGSASLDQMAAFRDRILQAIKQGYFVKPNGDRTIGLDIDTLGAVVEGSVDSPNLLYYGGEAGIHNYGHDLLAQICDPDGRYKNNFPGGVMGGTETACRDPVFYRWHRFIDDLFETYQQTQRPYTAEQLEWNAVEIVSVKLLDTDGHQTQNINTFNDYRSVTISYNLDFVDREDNVKVTMPYMGHDEFSYQFQVKNTTKASVVGTFRIFLAPVFIREGIKIIMEEYRTLCIELDKFTHEIPCGDDPVTITRSSSDSAVTIPWSQIAGVLDKSSHDGTKKNPICGCGWPDNLLVPRGTENGMLFSLFVMITDWNNDKVETQTGCKECGNAASYCGVLNEKYPDKRSMGFPFDRPTSATDLSGFISGRSNMAALHQVPDPTKNSTDAAITITYTGFK